MLIIAGLGNNIDEIPLGVIKYLKKSDYIFLEYYTNFGNEKIINFLKNIRKDINFVDRNFVENKLENFIINNKEKKILFLTFGNPLFATTHQYFIDLCYKNNIKYKIINSPSIFDEISKIGLYMYKFGMTISIPFHESESFYNNLINNLKLGYHTLILLDLDPINNKFLDYKEAINRILKLEGKYNSKMIDNNKEIIVCSRLGYKNEKIIYGKISDLLMYNIKLLPPICIIIPGNINEIEKEYIEKYRIK